MKHHRTLAISWRVPHVARRIAMLTVFLSLCGAVVPCHAQQNPAPDNALAVPEASPNAPPVDSGNAAKITAPSNGDKPALTTDEFWLSCIVLFFGLAVIIAQIWVTHDRNGDFEVTMRYIAITLIVSCAIYLITTGTTNSQMTPVIGLLGTLGGYIMGKMHAAKESPEAAQ